MKKLHKILSVRRSIIQKVLGIALASLALFVGGTAVADEGVEAAGKVRFEESCAVCHGEKADGKGPFAPFLTSRPPDLTVLSKNAGGEFPFNKVFDSIDGRTSPGAHGTNDMPIWGSEWKGTSVASETALRGRILEMIIYLRSIQQ